MEKTYEYPRTYYLSDGTTRTRICRTTRILKNTKPTGRPCVPINNAEEIVEYLKDHTKKQTCENFGISYYKLCQIS